MAARTGKLAPLELEARKAARTATKEAAVAGFGTLPDEAATRPQIAAKILGVSIPTVWRWAKAGKLTAIKLSAGTTGFRVSQVRQVARGG